MESLYLLLLLLSVRAQDVGEEEQLLPVHISVVVDENNADQEQIVRYLNFSRQFMYVQDFNVVRPRTSSIATANEDICKEVESSMFVISLAQHGNVRLALQIAARLSNIPVIQVDFSPWYYRRIVPKAQWLNEVSFLPRAEKLLTTAPSNFENLKSEDSSYFILIPPTTVALSMLKDPNSLENNTSVAILYDQQIKMGRTNQLMIDVTNTTKTWIKMAENRTDIRNQIQVLKQRRFKTLLFISSVRRCKEYIKMAKPEMKKRTFRWYLFTTDVASLLTACDECESLSNVFWINPTGTRTRDLDTFKQWLYRDKDEVDVVTTRTESARCASSTFYFRRQCQDKLLKVGGSNMERKQKDGDKAGAKKQAGGVGKKTKQERPDVHFLDNKGPPAPKTTIASSGTGLFGLNRGSGGNGTGLFGSPFGGGIFGPASERGGIGTIPQYFPPSSGSLFGTPGGFPGGFMGTGAVPFNFGNPEPATTNLMGKPPGYEDTAAGPFSFGIPKPATMSLFGKPPGYEDTAAGPFSFGIPKPTAHGTTGNNTELQFSAPPILANIKDARGGRIQGVNAANQALPASRHKGYLVFAQVEYPQMEGNGDTLEAAGEKIGAKWLRLDDAIRRLIEEDEREVMRGPEWVAAMKRGLLVALISFFEREARPLIG